MLQRANLDVIVVGGGAAGLVAAAGCAALGARTALVERHRLGGECTWSGCVPSKSLLHIARQAARLREAETLGIHAESLSIDAEQVMRSVRATRQNIYDHGESPAYLKQLGIRPLNASARFLDANRLEIERDGRRRELTFRSAIVATGSRPFIPEISGLDEIVYLTTDTLFEINAIPDRLAILGGGATGVEMAQAFARLGSTVTVITRDDQLLPGMDADAAAVLLAALRRDGVTVQFRSTISSTRKSGDDISITIDGVAEPTTLPADRLLIATGRIANTDGLGLDAAGIAYDRRGIEVDAYCRTNVRHILASGDVTPAPNLTHVAEDMSKAAAINALARLPVQKYETEIIPRVIYTDPEVSTVGKTRSDLDSQGINYDVIELPYDRIDRAVIEHQAAGFVRIYHRFGRVLGATIVGAQAGELIAEYAIAMKHDLPLPSLSGTMHAYPTMMLGARRTADQFYVRMLKPWMVRGFQLLYGHRGDIPDFIGTRTIV
ncbi:FAD-dependent oxidoreductase [soil metagenome]